MMFVLKRLFNRPRPDIPLLEEARGLSFPSGHAMVSFCFYGLLAYIIWKSDAKKWVKWVAVIMLFLLVLFIGFSRIYLKVHYASDVMAGFCVGLIWLVLCLWILKRIEKFSRRKVDPVVEPDPGSSLQT